MSNARFLALVVSAGAALRLILFNARSLWFDEAITLRMAALPWAEVIPRSVYMEATPPLHPLLLKAWSALFPDPLMAIRAFSWVCGVSALYFYCLLCRRLCGEGWRTPALLGMLSSFWIHLSQDGRCYAFFLLLALVHALLLLRLLERPRAANAVLYAAAGAAGLYTHNFYALVLLSHGIWALDTRARLAWIGAASGAGLAWLPWAPSFLRQLAVWRGVSVLSEPLNAASALALAGEWLFDPTFLGLVLGPALRVVGVLMLLLLAAGLRTAFRREEQRLAWTLLAVPLAGTLAVQALLGMPVAQARYLAFVTPFLYILLSEAAHAWGGRAARLSRAALLAVAGAGSLAYFVSTRQVDPRLPELSAVLRRAAAQAGTGTVVHLDPYYYLPLRYYYLPELTHRLTPDVRRLTRWEGHPGYPALLAPGELTGLGRVVLLDARGRLYPGRIGIVEARTLESALARQ